MYFEGDCFWGLKNPYVPVNVSNPTMAKVVELQAVATSQMWWVNTIITYVHRSAKGPSLARVLRKGELWWRGGMSRSMTGGKMTWNLAPSIMMLSVMSSRRRDFALEVTGRWRMLASAEEVIGIQSGKDTHIHLTHL